MQYILVNFRHVPNRGGSTCAGCGCASPQRGPAAIMRGRRAEGLWNEAIIVGRGGGCGTGDRDTGPRASSGEYDAGSSGEYDPGQCLFGPVAARHNPGGSASSHKSGCGRESETQNAAGREFGFAITAGAAGAIGRRQSRSASAPSAGAGGCSAEVARAEGGRVRGICGEPLPIAPSPIRLTRDACLGIDLANACLDRFGQTRDRRTLP